jgi:hypothetical protein
LLFTSLKRSGMWVTIGAPPVPMIL